MKAVVHVNNSGHQQAHGAAIKAGLEAHGVEVEFAPYDVPQPCDFPVIWGWKQMNVIEAAENVLVMEAGCIGGRTATRFMFTSVGWNGLAGRGIYPKVDDGGERWRRFWPDLMKPWRRVDNGYALLIGQVPGDAALYGLDLERWASLTCQELLSKGWSVLYRPHPLAGNKWRPEGADLSCGTLQEDLSAASLCVSFNSTTGVEAVLSGVPTVTLDEGAMAWPVTAHEIPDCGDSLYRPDRTKWAHELAWCQWAIGEIADGTAWAHLKETDVWQA